MEIRGGVGGEEAALFAGDLFRMYSRYAEMQGWKVEMLDANPTELGGFKEVSFCINGYGAYSKLKYEVVLIVYSVYRRLNLLDVCILQLLQ